MILLDTSALIFLESGHRRARALRRHAGRLCVSPVSVLELQFLAEIGRGRWRSHRGPAAVLDDPRWMIDDLSIQVLAERALPLSWTRDPFDRLIVAHALLRRWRLATPDARILEHLSADAVLEL